MLVEKTEGDAALRVNSGEHGEGLKAYVRVYLGFAGAAGSALRKKCRMHMHPNLVRHEHEIAGANRNEHSKHTAMSVNSALPSG